MAAKPLTISDVHDDIDRLMCGIGDHAKGDAPSFRECAYRTLESMREYAEAQSDECAYGSRAADQWNAIYFALNEAMERLSE